MIKWDRIVHSGILFSFHWVMRTKGSMFSLLWPRESQVSSLSTGALMVTKSKSWEWLHSKGRMSGVGWGRTTLLPAVKDYWRIHLCRKIYWVKMWSFSWCMSVWPMEQGAITASTQICHQTSTKPLIIRWLRNYCIARSMKCSVIPHSCLKKPLCCCQIVCGDIKTNSEFSAKK